MAERKSPWQLQWEQLQRWHENEAAVAAKDLANMQIDANQGRYVAAAEITGATARLNAHRASLAQMKEATQAVRTVAEATYVSLEADPEWRRERARCPSCGESVCTDPDEEFPEDGVYDFQCEQCDAQVVVERRLVVEDDTRFWFYRTRQDAE